MRLKFLDQDWVVPIQVAAFIALLLICACWLWLLCRERDHPE